MDRDTEYDTMHHPWRIGSKLKRTIYAVTGGQRREEDIFIGLMETAPLAMSVVDQHNLALAKEEARLAT